MIDRADCHDGNDAEMIREGLRTTLSGCSEDGLRDGLLCGYRGCGVGFVILSGLVRT